MRGHQAEQNREREAEVVIAFLEDATKRSRFAVPCRRVNVGACSEVSKTATPRSNRQYQNLQPLHVGSPLFQARPMASAERMRRMHDASQT